VDASLAMWNKISSLVCHSDNCVDKMIVTLTSCFFNSVAVFLFTVTNFKD
jgi:hypothetical protein